MIIDRPIPFLDLILSISDATELIYPKINQHGKRVAYIALNIANELGMDNLKKYDIILAGLLHDIGAFSLKEKLEALTFKFELSENNKEINRHGLLGYELLNHFKPFSRIALIIKYHHCKLDELAKDCRHEDIALASQIIHLADRIDVLIDNNKEVLNQVATVLSTIKEHKSNLFPQNLIDVLDKLAKKEYFWLDAVSTPQMNTFTMKLGHMPINFGLEQISEFARMFSYIIDFRSPFTATHSSGVTEAAASISRYMGLSPRECEMMRVAGFLHDLGKLSVPAEILNKPAGLTNDEVKIIRGHTYYTYHILDKIANLDVINTWASFHHEKLDGSGYPFHLEEKRLSIGSRIMAVADTFTAITEDRPYRKGMDKKSALKVLEGMAANNKIDGNVVGVVKEQYEDMNNSRIKAQNTAVKKYKKLGNFYL